VEVEFTANGMKNPTKRLVVLAEMMRKKEEGSCKIEFMGT
jgi:hypothetical protein